MNHLLLTFGRLALAGGLLAVVGVGPVFAHTPHHQDRVRPAPAMPDYIPYTNGVADPLGLTSTPSVSSEATGSIVRPQTIPTYYVPYRWGVGDPLGLTSKR